MINIHWSESYVKFITIEAEYHDGARQTWDYDCIQYETLESLKQNMSDDFSYPSQDISDVFFYFVINNMSITVDIGELQHSGDDFVNLVFDSIEDIIDGN